MLPQLNLLRFLLHLGICFHGLSTWDNHDKTIWVRFGAQTWHLVSYPINISYCFYSYFCLGLRGVEAVLLCHQPTELTSSAASNFKRCHLKGDFLTSHNLVYIGHSQELTSGSLSRVWSIYVSRRYLARGRVVHGKLWFLWDGSSDDLLCGPQRHRSPASSL